jgi:hypothetical protein
MPVRTLAVRTGGGRGRSSGPPPGSAGAGGWSVRRSGDVAEQRKQVLGLEGLDEVGEAAGGQGATAGLGIGVGGADDHRERGQQAAGLEAGQHLPPVDVGEPEVEEHRPW